MENAQTENNAACGASELTEVLCLAQRLRNCLMFDAPTPDESELEAASREAVNTLERMVTYAQEVEAWRANGEKLFDKSGASVMFSLGSWWADRPWRNREA